MDKQEHATTDPTAGPVTDIAGLAAAIDAYTDGTRDPEWCRGLATHMTGWLAEQRPRVVALCGSTRFREAFTETNRAETLAGRIVLAPGVFAHSGDPITAEQKKALNTLHLAKIDLADEVVIVAPGGYVGESTREEITRAVRTGKPIRWITDLDTERP